MTNGLSLSNLRAIVIVLAHSATAVHRVAVDGGWTLQIVDRGCSRAAIRRDVVAVEDIPVLVASGVGLSAGVGSFVGVPATDVASGKRVMS